MRLQDIMSSPVQTVAPDATVSEARAHLKRGRIHHLVVARGRTLLGVVSARDLATSAPEAPMVAVMSGDVVTARATTKVREAANLLRGHTIGCLPVVERGKLVGIVTTADLLELIGRGAEKPVPRTTRWTLRDRGPRKTGASQERLRLAHSRR